MGNQVERKQPLSVVYYDREPRATATQPEQQSSGRVPSIQNLHRQPQRLGRINNQDSGWQRCSTSQQSNVRHKKYLSLAKQSEVREEGKRKGSISFQKKGINLSMNSPAPRKQSLTKMINYCDMHSNKGVRRHERKSTGIKPRDLPRSSSHKVIKSMPAVPSPHTSSRQKIPSGRAYEEPIILKQQIVKPRPQPQPKRHINFQQYSQPIIEPQIQVQYVQQQEQPSIPAPKQINSFSQIKYIKQPCPNPNPPQKNWFQKASSEQIIPPKLKRVPLTPSSQLNSTLNPVTHENQEESVCIKEISEMSLLRNHLVNDTKHNITKIDDSIWNNHNTSSHNKQNHEETLFTDPHLMKYINANPLKQSHGFPFKESQSKYAVAYQCDGKYVEVDTNMRKSIKESLINKYAFASGMDLEEKIQKEVESEQVIEQPFTFPTATDISFDEKSQTNPSFLPIMRKADSSQKVEYTNLDQNQLIQYCKPKISSKVMADLLRLPLKS